MPRFFVPLSRWGRLCMKAKLHRGLIGILPYSVIRIAVCARSLWYNFTAFMSRCSSTTEQPNCNRRMERSSPPAGSSLTYQRPLDPQNDCQAAPDPGSLN